MSIGITCGSPPDATLGTPYTHTFPVTGATGAFNVASIPTVPLIRGSDTFSTASSSVARVTWPAGTLAGDLALIFVSGAWNVIPPAGWSVANNLIGGTWNGLSAYKVLDASDISTGFVDVNLANVFSTISGVVTFIGATGGVREFQGVDAAGGAITVPITTTGSVLSTDAGFFFGSVRGGTLDGATSINPGSPLEVIHADDSGQISSLAMPAGATTVNFCYLLGAGLGCVSLLVIVKDLASTGGGVVSEPLPPGLTLDSATGILSGTPTVPGVYPIRLYATDTTVCANATADCTITVLNPGGTLVITCGSPPNGHVGDAYSHDFSATTSGGTPPYMWDIHAGALPSGITLDGATGIVSGTPTVAGLFSFTIRATDSLADTASQPCTIRITGTALAFTCGNPPSSLVGNLYSHQLIASGGVEPYTYALILNVLPDGIPGILPPGLELDTATGIIFGTPTTPGVYPFVVRVTDAIGSTVQITCSITIYILPIQMKARSWCLINAYLVIEEGLN